MIFRFSANKASFSATYFKTEALIVGKKLREGKLGRIGGEFIRYYIVAGEQALVAVFKFSCSHIKSSNQIFLYILTFCDGNCNNKMKNNV